MPRQVDTTRQSDMARIPISPGIRARFDEIQQQIRERYGRRVVTQAEVVERIIEAWEESDAAMRELDEITKALRDAGIAYPPGFRGVQELIRQRDGYLGELEQPPAPPRRPSG